MFSLQFKRFHFIYYQYMRKEELFIYNQFVDVSCLATFTRVHPSVDRDIAFKQFIDDIKTLIIIEKWIYHKMYFSKLIPLHELRSLLINYFNYRDHFIIYVMLQK